MGRTLHLSHGTKYLYCQSSGTGIPGQWCYWDLRMRYELKATAARILTSAFYSALCRDGKTFLEAGYAARRAMQKDCLRPAHFGELVEIRDSIVPANYSVNGEDFRLVDLRAPLPPFSLPDLIGREDDIHHVSSVMRRKTSFLVASAAIGTGKSVLMKHLAWWWTELKLFRRVIYLDVSLSGSPLDTDKPAGLLALSKALWQSIVDPEETQPPDLEPIAYLQRAMEAAKIQNCIVILDGIDNLYHPS
ncbi:hypothetical protein N7490_009192 [Penicillium lividum]|nr:hypothetical protein N7490_009192 [Penicillium lividum]